MDNPYVELFENSKDNYFSIINKDWKGTSVWKSFGQLELEVTLLFYYSRHGQETHIYLSWGFFFLQRVFWIILWFILSANQLNN